MYKVYTIIVECVQSVHNNCRVCTKCISCTEPDDSISKNEINNNIYLAID